jgi:hypothetical protein
MTNGNAVTLYAWVHPLKVDPLLDHTWVTTYAPPPVYRTIEEVEQAGGYYWFCWGVYHPVGVSTTYPDGAIGNAAGDLALSSCICAPNDPDAHGSIFHYAWDGVCHQLANQVLYSTAGPLTVKLARGYWTSSHLYGTYGANTSDWDKLRNSCLGAQMATPPGDPPDDFADHVAEVLGADYDPDRLAALMALRETFHERLGGVRAELEGQTPEAMAENVNRLIAEHMAQAAEILGPEDYQRVYGVAAGEPVNLVDPDMVRHSRGE